ncbi:MAG: hypothetical protein JW953_20695 [Anaerolineae bacterium]|nr:hypothetical protein [Anaerolineae bacterium]
MSKISPELEQQLKAMPNRTVDLIVRTAGEATPHLEWLTAAGFQVKQQFRLSPGVAVSGSGQAALKLLTQSWVVSIELDAPVKTM